MQRGPQESRLSKNQTSPSSPHSVQSRLAPRQEGHRSRRRPCLSMACARAASATLAAIRRLRAGLIPPWAYRSATVAPVDEVDVGQVPRLPPLRAPIDEDVQGRSSTSGAHQDRIDVHRVPPRARWFRGSIGGAAATSRAITPSQRPQSSPCSLGSGSGRAQRHATTSRPVKVDAFRQRVDESRCDSIARKMRRAASSVRPARLDSMNATVAPQVPQMRSRPRAGAVPQAVMTPPLADRPAPR
jgi:hypothetical protein